ncbi:General alpha-glucoside permease [Fusarium oxysporum f. sp. albedinis]|nr:General alpha-glucoside permease [Fusarium oxysporum f. sp. albedinis]
MPDRIFVKYCLSVVNTIGTALLSGSRSPPTGSITGSEPRIFSCFVCRRGFSRRSNMQRHMRSIHRHHMVHANGGQGEC